MFSGLVNTLVTFKLSSAVSIIPAAETDILILAVDHLHNYLCYLSSQEGVYKVSDIWETLPETYKKYFLFSYVFSGCDTVSHIFGLGKQKFLKLVSGKLPVDIITIFEDPNSSPDDVKDAGVRVFKFLQTKGKRQDLELEDLRLQKYLQLCGKGRLQPERLVPTTGAAEMHALRVYWQLQEWKNLSRLDPSSFGWKKHGEVFHPIGSKKAVAPEKLLEFITCKCEKGCRGRCSCASNNMRCVAACTHCKGVLCDNKAEEPFEIGELSDDEEIEYFV